MVTHFVFQSLLQINTIFQNYFFPLIHKASSAGETPGIGFIPRLWLCQNQCAVVGGKIYESQRLKNFALRSL